MTRANKNSVSDVPAKRRGSGFGAARLLGQAQQAAAKTGGGSLADPDAVRDPSRRGSARWDNPWRTGRARKGAAALEDARDGRAGGTRTGLAQPRSEEHTSDL